MEKYQRERFVGNSQPLTLDVAPAPTLPLSIVQRAKSTYAHCPSCRVPWKTGGQKKTQNGDGMVPRLGISLYFILAYPLNLENVESFIGILFKRPWKSLIFHEMYHWCCPFSTQPCYAVYFLSLLHLSVSSRPFKIFSPQNKAEVYSEYPSGFYEEKKTSNTNYISTPCKVFSQLNPWKPWWFERRSGFLLGFGNFSCSIWSPRGGRLDHDTSCVLQEALIEIIWLEGQYQRTWQGVKM